MPLLKPFSKNPIILRLGKDLVRSLKRGHPWVYADALRQLPPALSGSPAILLDNKKGREVARGYYDPHSPLAFRVCTVSADQPINESWAKAQFEQALALRQTLVGEDTTGFRLFNGEGDGLPGLICDVYGQAAVLQLDGAGPAGFWYLPDVAGWVAGRLDLACVYYREQVRQGGGGRALVGETPGEAVSFFENGVSFRADIVQGQKTGFFLDQRENRQRIRGLAKDKRVVNVFGYTGGFSVYAGLGGARQVTTVDVAEPALALAGHNWAINALPPANHKVIKADAYQFLEAARTKKKRWGVVILDPPSFAPSKEAVPKARKAYQQLIAAGAAVTASAGFLAAASCSSHIEPADFLRICEEGVSLARKRATVLGIYGQPADHPSPLPFSEFRYLKFVLMHVT
ncbi:MAG: class I SAM-dependent rRNA methyltransferase [Anaerolineae bacterium]|nr:class I SAM-dependent rRNA methyltransferase [Anaerolineae bacterium]